MGATVRAGRWRSSGAPRTEWELNSLWANNVRLHLAPLKLAFREARGSCRLEINDAVERLRRGGALVVTVRDITDEVHRVAPQWSLKTIGNTIRREVRGAGAGRAQALPLERFGFAEYRITEVS